MGITRHLEKVATKVADKAWPVVVEKLNDTFEGEAFQPKWAPAPLLKSKERSFPTLGWPRETDSLCPKCVKETREAILSGQKDISYLIEGKPGEIKSQI